MGQFVEVSRAGGVAILTLNRPELMNAFSTHEDCRDLVDALELVGADESISCAVLTGAGKAFSTGGNVKAMKERNGIGALKTPADTRANYRRGVQRIPRAFQDLEIPIIAAVNGSAVGMGCDLACFCDIRIASESANFAASFIKAALVPGDGGAWALPRAVGYAKAAEMIFTGERISAQEALRIGLVSRIVEQKNLLPEALGLAGRIASNPSASLRLAKRLLTDAQNMRLSEVLEMSAAFQALAHETADHSEAVAAFIEKRTPVFKNEHED